MYLLRKSLEKGFYTEISDVTLKLAESFCSQAEMPDWPILKRDVARILI